MKMPYCGPHWTELDILLAFQAKCYVVIDQPFECAIGSEELGRYPHLLSRHCSSSSKIFVEVCLPSWTPKVGAQVRLRDD
jgi:hypothetical protein